MEAQDEERRQRAQRLLSRPLPQRKAEGMFLRCQPHLWSTTIRSCLFTLFRIEDVAHAHTYGRVAGPLRCFKSLSFS